MNCCDIVDYVLLRCSREGSEDIVGRSECDDGVGEGRMTVMARAMSSFQCDLSVMSDRDDVLGIERYNINTPLTGMELL